MGGVLRLRGARTSCSADLERNPFGRDRTQLPYVPTSSIRTARNAPSSPRPSPPRRGGEGEQAAPTAVPSAPPIKGVAERYRLRSPSASGGGGQGEVGFRSSCRDPARSDSAPGTPAAGAGGPPKGARPRRAVPAGSRRPYVPFQPCVKASPSKRSRVAISSTGRRLSLVSCLTGRPKGMTAQTA